jgi:hypothetical protein
MGRHRHSKTRVTLDDQNTTICWLESQLTYRTVSFVAEARAPPPSVMDLPDPQPEPELTPLSDSAGEIASIVQVPATAHPSTVHNNETQKLQLEYAVHGAPGAAVSVTERRTLTFGGVIMPGYPRQRSVQREPGNHASAVNQVIPARAAAGSYSYQGEVCIDTACKTHRTVFQVKP